MGLIYIVLSSLWNTVAHVYMYILWLHDYNAPPTNGPARNAKVEADINPNLTLSRTLTWTKDTTLHKMVNSPDFTRPLVRRKWRC